MSEVISNLNLPVILVVDMKLGCLNHALLTYQSMISLNTSVIGWIANCCQPDMQELNQNIETLKHRITAPYLGTIPFDGNAIGLIDTKTILHHPLLKLASPAANARTWPCSSSSIK